MIRFHSSRLPQIVLTLLLLSLALTNAYTSRMEDRGYNPSPYGAEVDKVEEETAPGRYDTDEGRVEGRGFNDHPVEDNVSGNDCMVNPSGVFMTVGNNRQEEPIFKYQLETKPKTEAPIRNIIKKLELAYLDKLLPILFPELCGNSRDRRQLRRRLKIMGATTNPPDEVLTSLECVAYNARNDCRQVEGIMHIYTDGSPFGLEKEVLQELERSMNNGEFNTGVHNAIVNVTYIDVGFDGLTSGTQNPGQTSSPERRFRAPYYALAAVGGLMVIAAGVIWKRRRDRADAASVLTGDTSTLQGAPTTDTQGVPATEEVKPEGDSTGLETTMDFSTIELDYETNM